MNSEAILLIVVFALLGFMWSLGKNSLTHVNGQETRPTPQAQPVMVGGEPVVTLKRPRSSDQRKPQFFEATVFPGRGMNLLQVITSRAGAKAWKN